MGRIEPDELTEPERVFVAWSLRIAQRTEELLTGNGVNYVVQVEQMGRSFLFGSARHAAVFYVASGQAAYCRTQLTMAGLGKGVVDEGG
jgi:hypothetical protein